MALRRARTGLLHTMRALNRASARERLGWIRDNLRFAMLAMDQDPALIHAIAGVSPGTVRNFLRGTDSSVGNVLLIAHAVGLSLGDLERPPDEFREVLRRRLDGDG